MVNLCLLVGFDLTLQNEQILKLEWQIPERYSPKNPMNKVKLFAT